MADVVGKGVPRDCEMSGSVQVGCVAAFEAVLDGAEQRVDVNGLAKDASEALWVEVGNVVRTGDDDDRDSRVDQDTAIAAIALDDR